MTGGYRVDLAALQSTVDRLASFGRQLEDARDDLDRHVRQLHAEWHGEAADEHHEAHRRWARGMAEVHEALTTMCVVARGAHDNYAAARRANLAMWGR